MNNINFHSLHRIKREVNKELIEFENGNNVMFDILTGIPPHQMPKVVSECDNVFAIGDVTEISTGGSLQRFPKQNLRQRWELKKSLIKSRIPILTSNLMERAFVSWRWETTKQDISKLTFIIKIHIPDYDLHQRNHIEKNSISKMQE